MAKIRDIFSGKLTGGLGNVVAASWKGIPYLRTRPTSYNSNTKAQQKQRSKFKVVIDFVNKAKPIINAGFKWNTEKMTELNSATSYIMKRAVIETEEGPVIDFPAVLVARGDLLMPADAKAVSDPGGTITISWTDNSEGRGGSSDDKALILLYNSKTETACCFVEDTAIRGEESYTVEIPEFYSGQPLETYLAFISPDGEEASNSMYLGSVVVEV